MASQIRTIVVIFLLWTAGLLAGAQFAKVSVLLPNVQAIYPTHIGHIAWLLTLVSIVGAVFGGLAGSFANRVGLKRLLVISLLAAGGLSIWQATYPPFVLIAATRVVEGITHLGIVVTAPALMAQLSNEKWRGAVMSLWSTFFGVSFAIFAWFGIPYVEVLNVSGLFQLHGLCLLITGALLMVLLHVPGEDEVSNPPTTTSASLLAAYSDPRVIWSGVGWLFYTLTFLALLTILPAQLSDSARAQTTTAMSLLGIGTSLAIVPLLLSKLNASTVVMLGFGAAIVATLLGVTVNDPLFDLGLFAILGLVQGGTFAAVAELNASTAKRTLGYGFMAQTGNIGNLIGTPLLLFIMNSSGSSMLLLVTALIYVVGLLCLWVLMRRIRQSGAPT